MNFFSEKDVEFFCKNGYVILPLPSILQSPFSKALTLSQLVHSSTVEQKQSIYCGNSNGIYGYSPSSNEIDNYCSNIPVDHICRRRNYSSFDFGYSDSSYFGKERILFQKNNWPRWISKNTSTICNRIYRVGHEFLLDFLVMIFDAMQISYKRAYFDSAPGVFRFLKYSALSSMPMGSPQHTDYEFLTLSYSYSPGLQLINSDGSTKDILQNKGNIIIQAGDCLELVTGGKIASRLHRVVVDSERYSLVHFICSKPKIYIKRNSIVYSDCNVDDSFCPSDHLLEMSVANNYYLEEYCVRNLINIPMSNDRKNPLNKKSI